MSPAGSDGVWLQLHPRPRPVDALRSGPLEGVQCSRGAELPAGGEHLWEPLLESEIGECSETSTQRTLSWEVITKTKFSSVLAAMWLSMDGLDSGSLVHCQTSAAQFFSLKVYVSSWPLDGSHQKTQGGGQASLWQHPQQGGLSRSRMSAS